MARTVPEAVALYRDHRPDLVIIDQRLADGGLGTEIAPQLGDHCSLGILYATGSAPQVIETATEGHGCLSKPYRSADLVRSVEIVAEMVTTGTASPPFPRGFQVLTSASIGPT